MLKSLISALLLLTLTMVMPTTLAQSPNAKTLFDQGVIEFWNGDRFTAEDLFSQAIEADPNYADAYAYRAFVRRYINRDYGMSYDIYGDLTQSYDLEPDNALFYAFKAQSDYDDGDMAGAFINIREAISADPQLIEANFVFALVMSTQNQFRDADYKSALDQLNSIQLPEYGSYWELLGQIQLQMGNSTEALQSLQKAISLAPTHWSSYVAISNTYLVLGQNEDALDAANSAVQLLPDNNLVYENRGHIYESIGDLPHAKADYEQALALHPGSSYAKEHLAAFAGVVSESVPTAASADSPTFEVSNSDALIAFEMEDGNDISIFTISTDGAQLTQVTDFDGTQITPDWSPDGKQIVFSSDHEGIFQLYIVNADGSDVRRLTTSTVEDSNPVWSADGSTIFFDRKLDQMRQIFAIAADGSNERQLTFGDGDSHDPNSTTSGVVFISKMTTDEDQSKQAKILTMDSNGENIHLLYVGQEEISDLDVSNSGEQIAFLDGSFLRGRLTLISADGKNPKSLDKIVGQRISWSPDDQQLAIASTDLGFVFVDSLLYIVNADGSGLEQINATLDNAFAPGWQPRTALASSPTVDTTEAVPLATPTNPTIFLSRAVDLYSSPSRFSAIYKTPNFVNVASLPVQGISLDGLFYYVEFSGYKGWILADGAVEFAGDLSLVPVVDEKGVPTSP